MDFTDIKIFSKIPWPSLRMSIICLMPEDTYGRQWRLKLGGFE
jgi:hypothetical protein